MLQGSEVAGTTFKVEEVKELMTAMLVGQAQGKSVRDVPMTGQE